MLQWLRKYSRSWFIGLAIGAIVVVFIFWGVGGLRSPRFQEAAKVNGSPILLTEYLKQYHELLKQYQEQYQGELTEELIKELKLREMALSRLIEERVLLQAATRLGVKVSKAELQEVIRSYPFFQEEGRFNERKYQLVLARARLGPAEFEEQQRQQLLIQKVIQEVVSFAKVSEGELQELFRMSKEAVDVQYLVVSPERFLTRQQLSEEEVARAYQEHQEAFRQPPRTKVNYLLFRPQDFLGRVQLSREEVEAYLKDQGEKFFRPKVIRARHILLLIPPKAPPAERQRLAKKAQEVLAKAKAGEDFSQLAKTYSQDVRSRPQGGDLGLVKRNEYKPQWERVAFSLKPGEVGLASTPQAYFIIKVEEIKETEKTPEGEERARQGLRDEKSRRLAKEAAQQAREDLSRDSMAAVAKKFGVTTKETPFLAVQDPVPELGAPPSFNQAAMKLKPKEVSQVLDLLEGFAVLQGVATQPEQVPPLEQVKEQVRQWLKREQAKKLAEEEASRLLERLRKGEPLARVAGQARLPFKDSGFFTRFRGFLEQPGAESLTSAAFQLSSQHPYPQQPLLWQDNFYLLAFKARRAPDPAEFQKEREKLKNGVLEHKQQLIFASWLAAEKQRAKIKVYELP